MASPDITVHHRPEARRYEANVDGEVAVAEYELVGNDLIFTHTFVPPALRGRGIAEVIVRAALDDARAQGRRIVPRCSYVARFVARHPEYSSSR